MKTVLIIDDDQQNCELVRALLLPSNINVISSADGEDGVRRAQLQKPDLIIIDLILEGNWDGMDVVQAVRSHANLQDIPLLAMTAHHADYDLSRFIASCDAYLDKPFKLADFHDVVRQLIGK